MSIPSVFELLLAVSVLSSAAGPPAAHACPVQGCDGCVGAGGSASASGGSCGGMVMISVQVERGTCKWFSTEEPLLYQCKQTGGCHTTIHREWSGLPPSTSIDFCLTTNGDMLCLRPKPSSGSSGNGSSDRNGPELSCSDAPGAGITFSVESSVCGLEASVHATCSDCSGEF